MIAKRRILKNRAKKDELLGYIEKLEAEVEFLHQTLAFYSSYRRAHILNETTAWDIRNMIPLAEFSERYLRGGTIKNGYSLVQAGKVDAHTILYKYRTTDTVFKRFTVVPLTRRNLEFCANYIPAITHKVRSRLRVAKLINSLELEIPC